MNKITTSENKNNLSSEATITLNYTINKSSKALSINDTPPYCITEIKFVKLVNVNKIMIGNLNINFFPNKFDQLNEIEFSLDILVVPETKVDNTFPARLSF